jgi:uncharacterized protein
MKVTVTFILFFCMAIVVQGSGCTLAQSEVLDTTNVPVNQPDDIEATDPLTPDVIDPSDTPQAQPEEPDAADTPPTQADEPDLPDAPPLQPDEPDAPDTPPAQLDPLDAALGTLDLTVKGERFRLWIADEPSEQERGLMRVTPDRMSPLPDGTRRGMIFIYDQEQYLSFWMHDTIIPLEIAYLDSSGLVVDVHTMAPLDERLYPSGDPARIAIEVNAGDFGVLGMQANDQIVLPDSVLKRRPD